MSQGFDLSYNWGGLGDFGLPSSPYLIGEPSSSAGVQNSLTSGLLATLGGWVKGVADVDVAKRITQVQNQNLVRMSNQNPGNTPDMTTRGAAYVGGMRVGDLLPLLVLAGVGYVVLKKL